MTSRKIIGVDIGGTKTAVVMGDMEGRVLDKVRFPTSGSWQSVVGEIGRIIRKMTGHCSSGEVLAIGVSCGGPLDSGRGLICSPPNLPGWDEIPVCLILTGETGLPCYLENDANACALAEWMWGAGKGLENIIFLTFGTGLGAGLILNGKLYRGSDGLAGEVGHLRMSADGPEGYGKRGSWEAYCSGGGLSRHFSEVYGEKKSGREICAMAREKDPRALMIISEAARYLGRGVAGLIDIFNPQTIIIGSVFARDEELFRSVMEEEIAIEALPVSSRNCRIVPSDLGESLGDRAALGVAINGLSKEGDRDYAILPEGSAVPVLDDLIGRYPLLSDCRDDIEKAVGLIIGKVEKGGKIFLCGNGGSSSDADHIVGELMKSFTLPRPLPESHKDALRRVGGSRGGSMGDQLQRGIPAISLSSATSLNTAFLNDVNPQLTFAQYITAMGRPEDIFWGLSTSGNSANVVSAAIAAKAMGLAAIGMTGCEESELSGICDCTIRVNETETYKVQELHLPVYHAICLMLEQHFFGRS